MQKEIIFILMLILTFSGVWGQTRVEKKIIREEKAKREYLKVKQIIESKSFLFFVNRVTINTGSSLSIVGEGYYLNLKKDSVNTILPYFGVLYSSNGYRDGGGIKFKSLAETLKIEYDDIKKRIRLKFSSVNLGERLEFEVLVFKNGEANIMVGSIYRTTINYSGKLYRINEEINDFSIPK
ncbi:DUF4251 domain-containing protein [uncultured Maribacter sp.]|uniref:DUF4251 domain-containing protein n=1 Tax=uncultured Maribacter sp. TaxID=431308 RepID=UPI002602A282|nr:DUF4251 domain-containing protein [uncultured Maribacter sp.]